MPGVALVPKFLASFALAQTEDATRKFFANFGFDIFSITRF